MLEIQPGRFVLKSRESLHGRELDVVVDSLTGVNYVTYLASSSAPLSPLLDRDRRQAIDRYTPHRHPVTQGQGAL